MELSPGDNALIFYGDAHRLGEGRAEADCPPPAIHAQAPELIERRQVGQGPFCVVLLQSVIELIPRCIDQNP